MSQTSEVEEGPAHDTQSRHTEHYQAPDPGGTEQDTVKASVETTHKRK